MESRKLRCGSPAPGRVVLAALLWAAGIPGAGAHTDPYEPNDAWNQATPLQNGVPLEAWISPSADRDWFTFAATRTGQFSVRLQSLPADYDLYLARLNPQTQQLDGIPYGNQPGTTPEYYSGLLPATGAYYVRVYAEDGVHNADDSYTLQVTWPAATPVEENVLAVGTAQGAPGTAGTVAVMLENGSAVKALQADLGFDPALVTFQTAQAVGRAAEMTCAAALQDTGRVRVLLFESSNAHLPPGSGAVINLTFTLVGAAGSQSVITPVEVLVSDLDAGALVVATKPGALAIIEATVVPVLRLYALRNPAHPRTLQILAACDQALVSPPSVTASGQAVGMTALDGAENLYQGTFHAPADADSVRLSATGTNGVSVGAIQTEVVF